jgi:hypothetical protein
MKKLLGMLIAMLLICTSAFSIQWSFKINGGLSMIGLNGNDYNKFADGFMAFVKDWYPDFTGEMGKFSTSILYQGEVILAFTPSIGVGLGGSYFSSSRSDSLTFSNGGPDNVRTYSPRLSAAAVFLNGHYFLPLGGKMKLDFYGGPVLAFGSFSFPHTDSYDSTWLAWDWAYTFEAKGDAFGFQAGVGLSFQLAKKIALTFDVLWRLAPWGSIQGTETVDGFHRVLSETVLYDDTFEDEFVWLINDGEYDLFMFQMEEPTVFDTVKKAKFDLGGLAAAIGIKIGLF